MAKDTYCRYEDDMFEAKNFGPDGLHIGADPPHFFTGALDSTSSGGNTPLDAPPGD